MSLPGPHLRLGSGIESKHATVFLLIRSSTGEVVEGTVGHVDDVVADEDCPFSRAGSWVLQATLPLQHRPAGIVVLRHFAEDGAEVDLSIAERAEASWPIDPILIAAIDAALARGAELSILDVEGADTVVVDIEECEIIQLLQDHVAGIVKNVGALMVVHLARKRSKVMPSWRSSPGWSSKQTSTPTSSKSLRIGSQRRPSSWKASSMSPAGRCGQG